MLNFMRYELHLVDNVNPKGAGTIDMNMSMADTVFAVQAVVGMDKLSGFSPVVTVC